MIKPEDLIDKFKYALNHNWGYIWGGCGEVWTQAKQNAATREMTKAYGSKWIGHNVVDCSGLFVWAFKQLDGHMYHGSNTMFLKYTTSSGILANGEREDKKELLPGTAVFKWDPKYTNPYYHVGLYIGDGVVIEAQGTKAGVITSTLASWNRWGELKGVDYGNDADSQTDVTPVGIGDAHVIGGKLKAREKPSLSASVIEFLPNETPVKVLEVVDPNWVKVSWETTGYVMRKWLAEGSN